MIGRIIAIKQSAVRQREELAKYESLSGDFEGDLLIGSNKAAIHELKEIGRFKIHCVPYEYGREASFNVRFFLAGVLFALRSRLRSSPYDLVTTYDPLKTGLLGVVIAGIVRARLAPEVNGVYTAEANYLDGGSPFRNRCKQWLYPRLESLVLKRSDGIKLLFPGQIDPFRSVLDQQVIRAFFNPVSVVNFLDHRQAPERTEILFVGSPFWLKGVDLLIDAFKRIAPDFPDWRLKILGWFPNRRELDDHIGGHPQIFHHPPVPTTEMADHMGSCAIFVLPSRTEAMGRVLQEAMAMGKARIGSDVDGIPTVIEDGIDGLLFESENVEDLADKLALLAGDPDLRRKLGENARSRAQREFSSQEYLRKLTAFYQDVIER